MTYTIESFAKLESLSYSLGPASYLVTAADLHPVIPGNLIFKFVDDKYLLIPTGNNGATLSEIDHIEKWATDNKVETEQSNVLM